MNLLKRIAGSLLLMFMFATALQAQADRWQQRVKYKMDVNLDVQTHVLKGKQSIEYWNNSPDTLKVLFFHMYWNAFQPFSMMDMRNRELARRPYGDRGDWDTKLADRIQKLQVGEAGYQKMVQLKVNGKIQQTEDNETILKVILDKPILPKTKALLETEFEARVPIQIRRSGRDNAEGVHYSMSQWYPALVEYDMHGWNPAPYIGKEFYGVWGDYEVNITLDRNFIIGASGYLQNPQEIGYGYEAKGMAVKRPAGNTLTWKFVAPNVHDFVWAADPDYVHETRTVRDGLVLHAFYKISPEHLKKTFEGLSSRDRAAFNNSADLYIRYYQREWQTVLDRMEKALPFMEKTFGKYPYKQYSLIQGGDGGMEYPMATLLKGAGETVIYHEFMHSFYQGLLATNETKQAWMDEGFAQYAENRILGRIAGDTTPSAQNPSYDAYFRLVKSGLEEPLTTPANHFESTFGYTTSTYDKGAVLIEQLGYIIGAGMRDQVLLEYLKRWKYRHPEPDDFFRVAEDVSGIKLDWYREYFVNSTKTIDYGIDSLWQENNLMKVRLKNRGRMPMPIDVMLTFKDGSREMVYIPMYLMFGAKINEDSTIKRTVTAPWRWTDPLYVFEIPRSLLTLKSIEIDPSLRMADIDRRNNKLELNW